MESHAARYAAEKLTLIESPEYLAHDRLQAGTSSILPLIAARYQIVIVTLRHSRRNLLGQLEALGIAGGFTAVLSDPAAGRQGWETKRDLVGAAGIPTTSDDFFAGDTETDILAGRALGVRTVAVCNGIRDEAHLRGLAPDLILPSLIDLNTTQLLT
jgi:phosphoglycolate phosphatase-like HAD superfamily hydrolase